MSLPASYAKDSLRAALENESHVSRLLWFPRGTAFMNENAWWF